MNEDGIIATLAEAMRIFTKDVMARLPIHLISFGWTPVIGGTQELPKANLYLDCRTIANPHHVGGLSSKSGADPAVIKFVEENTSCYHAWLDEIEEAISRLPVRRRDEEDPFEKPFIVACGCAWGVHRSVAMKYILEKHLRSRGWERVEIK